MSVYYKVAAPVTIGLSAALYNEAGENVAILYSDPNPAPPLVTPPPPTTTPPPTQAAGADGGSDTDGTADSGADAGADAAAGSDGSDSGADAGADSGSDAGSADGSAVTTTPAPWTTTTTTTTTTSTYVPVTADPSFTPTPIYSSDSQLYPNPTSYKKLNVMEAVMLEVSFGEYVCKPENGTGDNMHAICGIKDNSGTRSGISMPPVRITVDYGDGSGEQIWSREEPALLWTHKYQLPGRYWVHVSSKSGINRESEK